MIFIVRGPLRRFVGFKREVQIEATTVLDGVHALCREYPELQRVLLDGAGRVRGVHRLALNRTILLRDGLETPVANDDVLEVVTALAGG